MLDFDQSSIGAFLKQKFADFQPQMVSYEYGTVDSCADGIVHVSGLSRAKYGELLEFAGDLYGIALDMSLQGVSAALLSGGSVRPGSVARGTGRVADVCVGRELLGGAGAIRVHGGGFAGTIQAFVPEEKLSSFRAGMEALLGPGTCHILHIRPQGGCTVLS